MQKLIAILLMLLHYKDNQQKVSNYRCLPLKVQQRQTSIVVLPVGEYLCIYNNLCIYKDCCSRR